ncbi:hypothetical protein KA047_00925 [Candidatus Saccharibacteria bacterium]|nr:hypothetical protein [Candidatus Saccharibacteria bacterium]
MLDYVELTDNITKVFIEADKYQLDKHVPEFKRDGKYIGDFFSLTMFELDGDNPPLFYHTYSPYDTISSKSSDYAVVFRAGEPIFTTEFTPYMRQRTGSMTSVVIKGLGVNKLEAKKVVFIGTGKTATQDLRALKANFPELKTVAYINRTGKAPEFLEQATKLDVAAQPSDLTHIGDFDIIICHTSSKEAVLTKAMKNNIKKGALITTFASEDSNEVASEFFDTNTAAIIIDWEKTTQEALELKAAVDQGIADGTQLVSLKALLENGLDNGDKQYTIYRSHGTPMQNLAALQLLLRQTKYNSL